MKRLALLAFLVFVASACGQSHPSSQPSALLLGAIYPLSGPQATGGKQELAGVEAALQVAEAQGAPKVRLQVIDATTPEEAASAVDTLVNTYHVPAILGTYGSTLSAAASARAEELKTVYWETGAVADPITSQRHYVFRTVATGSALGHMAVQFTHDVLIPGSSLTSPRAVVIRVDDIYGRAVGGGEQQLAQSEGINVVDVIEYDPKAFDADVIAARLAAAHADFLWDVSYIDDGIAIWQAILKQHISLRGAIGTSSAFCMPEFSQRLGAESIGVFAADKPNGDISSAALSPSAQALLTQAKAIYRQNTGESSMDIPAVAGFVGGWTLFHDVLPRLAGGATSDSIRTAALNVDVPVGDSINGGGVRFGQAGALDAGQNSRAAAVVGQWQGVGVMTVLYPAAFATGKPEVPPYGGM